MPIRPATAKRRSSSAQSVPPKRRATSAGRRCPATAWDVESVRRLTNTYLQSQSYTEQGLQGSLTAQQNGLQGVQQNFPEPSGNGISSQMTQYWKDWSTLANNPSDSSAQLTVVQDGGTLASSLNQTSTSLTTLSQQTVQSIQGTLSQVNEEASQIASLNKTIAQGTASNANGGSGGSVNQLSDQRDQLVSQLSGQLGVRVTNNADGTVNLYSGSEALVSGDNYQQLSLSSSGPPYSLAWSNDRTVFQPGSGQVAGMLDVVNNYVPGYQQNLDQVSQSLMGSVNYLMSKGYDQSGNTGVPFFLGTGARRHPREPRPANQPGRHRCQRFLLLQRVLRPPTRGRRSVAAQVGELLANRHHVGAAGRRLALGESGVGVDDGYDNDRHGGRCRLQPARHRHRAGHFLGEQPGSRPTNNYLERQFGAPICDRGQHGPGTDEHGHVPERL